MSVFVVHHNDLDGFGAAYAAWRKFGNEAKYYEVNYGPASEKLLEEIPDGSEVYVLDFSYCRDVTEKLAARCKLTVIDHHKSAKSELVGLDYCHIDLTKAGCVLAWEYFVPGVKLPKFLAAVGDRDTWSWELQDTKEITAALFAKKKEFGLWHRYCDERQLLDLIHEGKAIISYEETLVNYAADRAKRHNFKGHNVPVVNSTTLISETAQRMLKNHPDAPFAVVYQDVFLAEKQSWARRYSLRSNGFDVSELAKKFGGGGHRQSSGFEEIIQTMF